MATSFGRVVQVQLQKIQDPTQWTVPGIPKTPSSGKSYTSPGIRIAFSVKQNEELTLNPATVSLWNLNRNDRDSIVTGAVTVVLTAGYGSDTSILFRGTVDEIGIRINKPDIETILYCYDGKQYADCTPNAGISSTPILTSDIIYQVTQNDPVNIPLDSVSRSMLTDPSYGFKGSSNDIMQPSGFYIDGTWLESLQPLVDAANLVMSIQSNQLIIRWKNKLPKTTIVSINPSTGLLTSPELILEGIGAIPQTSSSYYSLPHEYTFSCLLNPKLIPGNIVALQDPLIKDFNEVKQVRLIDVEHRGDTHGEDFTSNCTVRTNAL